MIISVFGAGSPKQNDQAYLQAFRLGKLLAQNGHVVITGGYFGTMEATSKGAKDAGGEVWGFTCKQLEDWRPIGPNQYIDKVTQFNSLQERIYALISECDAAIALPGGIGTLAEINLLWTHLQTESIKEKPFILIGYEWKTIMSTFKENMSSYISPDTYKQISFAPTEIDAINYLK